MEDEAPPADFLSEPVSVPESTLAGVTINTAVSNNAITTPWMWLLEMFSCDSLAAAENLQCLSLAAPVGPDRRPK